MKRLFILFVLILFALASVGGAFAQPAAPASQTAQTDRSITANRVIGEVTAVDSSTGLLTIKSDSGIPMNAVFDKTLYFRSRPGATDLEGATPITLADIRVGDRVYARGTVDADKKTISTRQLVVMTKADIADKQERDREDWRRRGVVGTVSAVNPQTREIILQVRSFGAAQPITITADGTNIKFRRYAPDSVRFADAKTSAFDEIRAGDQLRAKGVKNEDGIHFSPEEIVSGAFRSIRGSVVSVDPQSNEIKVKDMTTGKSTTIVISKDSMVRRIPAEFVQRLAMRGQRPAGATGATGESTASATDAQPRTQGEGGARRRPEGGEGTGMGGRRPMGGRQDMQDMLERMPAVVVSDLKPGEMVIVSSTVGADPSRVTAIALITGVEAFMQAPTGARGNGAAGTSLGLPSGALDIGIGLP
ncbi:MAG: hypothetical protein QOJ64_781 [Acidobacteriota bacterium]|jgi:hypothetical protein|nr:hypothetical protein [Acidobacteriota bacterium]